MNKNMKSQKNNKLPTSSSINSSIESKAEKKHLFQKSVVIGKSQDNKNNKIHKKQRTKFNKKNDKRYSPNNLHKNNQRIYSTAKSKPRNNNQNLRKIISTNKKEKKEENKKEISLNIHKKINNENNDNVEIDKPTNSLEEISNVNKFNFLNTKQNVIKINVKKISKDSNKKEEILKDSTNSENSKDIPLNDVSSIFSSWQNNSLLYKIIEEKLLKNNGFEIDSKTLKIKTKNSETCLQLQDQKFWILYIEYLINISLIVNEKQFLSVINEAFTYMSNSDCVQLITYYLQKIKKYSPCFLIDGSLDERDDVYFNKLNKSTANFIKNQKISCNIKIKRITKKNISDIYENDGFLVKNLSSEYRTDNIQKNNEIKNKNKNNFL